LANTYSQGRTKPPPGARVAFGHPLAYGLVGLWLFNEGYGKYAKNAANPSDGILTNVPVWRPPGVKTAAADTSYIQVANFAPFNTPRFTLEVLSTFLDGTAYSGPCYNRISGQFGFQANADDSGTSIYKPHLTIINSSGTETNQFKSTTTFTYPITRIVQTVWTWDGTNARFYIDGRDDNATTSAVSGFSQADNFLRLGYGYGILGGIYEKLAIYNRALTADEVRRLYVEPYCMVNVPVARKYYNIAGAAPSTKNYYGGGSVPHRVKSRGFAWR